VINRTALSQCINTSVLKRSLVVSAIVGTILCAINQGDAILAGETPVLWKVILTYIVPFCVATYGAYSAFVDHPRITKSERETSEGD